MNLYILILCITYLFFISLIFSKNVFSPVCIIMISYLVSSLLIVPNIDVWNINLHNKTIIIIIIGLFFFFLGYFIFFLFSKNQKKNKCEFENIKISIEIKIILILFQLLIVFLTFYYVNKLVGGISVNNFSASMEKYRAMSAYDSEIKAIPGIVTQMSKVCNIIFYFCAYIFINNYFYNTKNKQKSNNNIIFFLITFGIQIMLSIMNAGRYNMICLIIGLLVMYTILKAKDKDKVTNVFKIRDYIKITALFITILIVFSSMRTLVGRTNTSDFVSYISSYFGGSIPLYDKYLVKYENYNSEHLGFNTFHSIYRMLNKLGLSNVSRTPNYEFMQSGSLNGNVYTSFVVMYDDFGYVGVIILQFISGFIWAYFFQKTYLKASNSKNSIVFTIIYAIHISSLFLHFYGENFFSKVFSQAFILELIYINIIYFLIFKLKLKFKLR